MRQLQGHALGAEGLFESAVEGPDLLDGALEAAGQHHDPLTHPDDAAGDLAAETAEIMELGIGGVVGTIDPLHGEPEALKVPVAGDVHAFQVAEQRRPGIPRGVRGGIHHVVAIEGAQGDELHILDVEAWQEALEGVADLVEAGFGPTHQIHLVDRDHQVRDPQQRGQVGVTAGLFDDSLAGIDQHDRQIRRRGARDHVAGVLHMARGVGHDELAPRRGEVAVGDIDGDALLALGPESVGQVGEVDLAATSDVGGTLQRLQLILHDRLGVVEQPADERGLSIVHRAAGVEAQQFDRMSRDRHDQRAD